MYIGRRAAVEGGATGTSEFCASPPTSSARNEKVYGIPKIGQSLALNPQPGKKLVYDEFFQYQLNVVDLSFGQKMPASERLDSRVHGVEVESLGKMRLELP